MYHFSLKSKNYWATWQKVIAVIVCLSMVWVPMAVNVKAEDGTFIEKGVKYESSGEDLTVVGFDVNEMPSYVTLKKGTTRIGKVAFANCNKLQFIKIPNSVKSIGDEAFFGCSNLQVVTISGSIESVETGAFALCESLTHIVVPKGFDVMVFHQIGMNVNFDSKTFSTVGGQTGQFIFDDGITLPDFSFYFFEDGIKYVESGYVLGVVGFDKNTMPSHVTLREGTKGISDKAFYGCTGLKSIKMPQSIYYIGKEAFFECSNLESVTIPEGVRSIENNTFRNCLSLTSISIPSSVVSIGDLAFSGCRGLTSINIPEGVESIGKEAFNACRILRNINIPNSVTSIGLNVFDLCKELDKIIVPKGYDTSLFKNSIFRVSEDGKTFINGYAAPVKGEFIFYEDITPPAGGKPIRHYVDSKGETSIDITGDGVFWLKEESTDVYTGQTTHAWYGIDNSEGIFKAGSRFYVQWLSSKENPDECLEVLENFDMKALLQNGWESSGYIFKVGVIDPDGEKYTDLNGKTVKLHVQLGDDWNLKSLKAYWIGSGMKDDETIDIVSENREGPEAGDYGIMTLHHFSPYIVFDDPLEGDEEATDDSQLQVVDLENGKATDAVKNTSGAGKSSGSQKQTGDLTSIVFIGVLGLLTMLSAAYLIIQKRKNSSRF